MIVTLAILLRLAIHVTGRTISTSPSYYKRPIILCAMFPLFVAICLVRQTASQTDNDPGLSAFIILDIETCKLQGNGAPSANGTVKSVHRFAKKWPKLFMIIL